MPEGGAELFGIIGQPLGHSMSPPLHNWAFGKAGFAGEYRAFPVEPSQLDGFMGLVRTTPLSGLSVTIPHKVAVMPYLDGVSARAKAVGAVNTLYWRNGELLGENTDVHGFLAPLETLPTRPGSALVLGAGGAARAALAGLKELGVPDVAVTNRTADKAAALAREFGVHQVPWDDRAAGLPELLVNTTPLGMKGEREHLSPWPEDACLSPGQVAYDMVYNPQETVFLRQAATHACRTIDGLSMFVHQGAEQFRLWTGSAFDLDGARGLVAGLLQSAA